MVWIRGILFTVAVPGVAMLLLPALVDPRAHRQGGLWDAGFVVAAAGAVLYLSCLYRFLAAGGTPLIYFARRLRPVFGEEPPELVAKGPYRFSRNPMYLAVVTVVFGQAVAFASWKLALLAVALWSLFHGVVVVLEEPHLRSRYGTLYEAYCRAVPRWLRAPGRRRPPR